MFPFYKLATHIAKSSSRSFCFRVEWEQFMISHMSKYSLYSKSFVSARESIRCNNNADIFGV